MLEKPAILLQLDVFSEDELLDSRSIISKYFKVTVASDKELYMGDSIKWQGAFRGSLYLAHKLRTSMEWTDTLQWLPILKKWSVHKEYFFLDLNEITVRDSIHWPKFVRPCSGKKIFSGNVYSREGLQRELDFLVQNKNVDNTLCLVSKPQQLKREWRCIFIDNDFCAGSQYMLNGEKDLKPELPEEVKDYAIQISRDPFFLNRFEFIIDIAETNEGLRLVEINAFPTSSFYLANLDLVYSTYANYLQELS